MSKYEELLCEADMENLSIDENYPFTGNLSGLYINGNIALSDKLVRNADKACILAEEIGHYHTAVGDILDQSNTTNRKAEMQGRLWAYNRLVGLNGIINAFKAGEAHSLPEMAEYLEVSQEFLAEALERYRSKYGVCTEVDNYIIYFIPQLAVMEI